MTGTISGHRLGLEPAGEAENLAEAKRLISAGIGFLPTVQVRAAH
jgi:hypothetical protein